MPNSGLGGSGGTYGSLLVPQWLVAIYAPVAGAIGAAILALINRSPKFQEVVNKSTKTLLDAQEARIAELSRLVELLTSRITLLENALISNGVQLPPHPEPRPKPASHVHRAAG